jgi:ribosomal protein L37E
MGRPRGKLRFHMECRSCGSPVRRLDDVCPACGAPTGQRTPWYAYALGAVVVLLLFLWLSDFAGLVRFITGLGRLFQQ